MTSGGKRRWTGRQAEWATPPRLPVRESLIGDSISRGEIEVAFQPWIALGSDRVVAVEALARSAVEPDTAALFGGAHRAGKAADLSRLVQFEALSRAARWTGALEGMSLSLNLLPEEAADGAHARWLLSAIDALGIDPQRVIVEITESAMLSLDDGDTNGLASLKQRGVRIALDDFGTGYASLHYLTRLPLDLIKIDRGLVSRLVEGRRAKIVMRALIRLAGELGLQTLVEGVESPAQRALLAVWGCDLYQGFLGSAALDETDLARFVAASHADAA